MGFYGLRVHDDNDCCQRQFAVSCNLLRKVGLNTYENVVQIKLVQDGGLCFEKFAALEKE